jgi:hypothetical protein
VSVTFDHRTFPAKVVFAVCTSGLLDVLCRARVKAASYEPHTISASGHWAVTSSLCTKYVLEKMLEKADGWTTSREPDGTVYCVLCV